MKMVATKLLNRRRFLAEIVSASSGAALTNEVLRRKADLNLVKELWLRLQTPSHSSLTYDEILPPQLVQTIEDRIGTFGYADLLVDSDSYRMTENGVYFNKPEEIGMYDCVSSTLEVFRILAENRHAIPNYLSHRIRQGYDKRGINTQHFWVELILRNGWGAESITIDMTPPYKGKNPEHLALQGIPMVRDGTSIKLGNGMIYASQWEGNDSQYTFVSTMGIKEEDGKIFAQYAINCIPKDDSKEVTMYELWIDMTSFEMTPFKARIKGTRSSDHRHVLEFEQEQASIDGVLDLMCTKDKDALRTMIKVYTGIEPSLTSHANLYTHDSST